MRDRCPIKLPKGFGSGGTLLDDASKGVGQFWVMMEDVSGPGGVLEYEQVEGLPNYDHAEEVVRMMATNHGAWWGKDIVGDKACGMLPAASSGSALHMTLSACNAQEYVLERVTSVQWL